MIDGCEYLVPEPTDIEACERWLRAVTDGAAYLELWGCDDFADVSSTNSRIYEQEIHRSRILYSMKGLNSETRHAYLATEPSISGDDLTHIRGYSGYSNSIFGTD